MNKKTLTWVIFGVILLVALFALPSLWMWGRGGSFYHGYGMMGGYYPGSYHMMGGRFGFGWLVPALFLGLVIAAGVWVGNSLSQRNQPNTKSICPNCSKPVEEDWQTCPYCSTKLY